MMLMGAEILFYPTAIGTEPHDPDLDTSRLWRRAMIGHAVSNVVPVVAANRIGTEGGQRFYGHSFICDERGDMLAEFGAEETGVLVADTRPRRGQEAPRRLRLLPRPPAGTLRAADAGRLSDACSNTALEHRRVEPPGVLIVAAAVIAIDQRACRRKACTAPWANLALASGTPKLRHRLSCATLPSAMKVVRLRQAGDRFHQERAAIGFLDRQRLVLRRQAFDRVEDDRALEPQPVVAVARS